MFDRVGLALKAVREIAGLSQAELARRSGLGKSQISKYERGQQLPNLGSLGKILGVVNAHPLFFFYVAQILEGQASAKPGVSAALIEGDGFAILMGAEGAAYQDVFRRFVTLFETAAQARVLWKTSPRR